MGRYRNFKNYNYQVEIKESAPEWYDSIEQEYLRKLEQKLELEEDILRLRNTLHSLMKCNDIPRIQTHNTNVWLVRSYEGRRINSTKLRKEYPSIFQKYSIPYTVKEHIQFNLKKEK